MSLVLVATVFAAVSGYVIMLLAGRRLGASGYAEFTVFWALFFTLVGITNGTMQESTRAVSVARAARAAGPDGGSGAAPNGMQPIRAAVGIGAGLAVVSVATAPLWGQWVLPGNELLAAGLLGLAVWSVTVQATLWGLASGTARWPLYAAGIVVDAALRLVVVAAALALGYGLIGFVVATVAGAAGWLLLLTSPGGRAAAAERVDEDTRAYLGRAGHAMLASAATAVLIVGFPVLLAATSPGSLDDTAGSLLFSVTVTRAPLLVPLTAFQSAVIVYFVERTGTGLRALRVPLAAVAAVGAIGAGLAWLLGPPVVRWVGDGFDISGPVLAALTAGAALTAMLLVTGSAAVAADRHRGYAIGWWAATAVAVAVLAVPSDMTVRVCAALIVGPLIGVCLHLVLLTRGAPKPGSGAPRY